MLNGQENLYQYTSCRRQNWCLSCNFVSFMTTKPEQPSNEKAYSSYCIVLAPSMCQPTDACSASPTSSGRAASLTVCILQKENTVQKKWNCKGSLLILKGEGTVPMIPPHLEKNTKSHSTSSSFRSMYYISDGRRCDARKKIAPRDYLHNITSHSFYPI